MLNAIQKFMPDIYQMIMKRYAILSMIASHEPIGRRALAKKTELSETALRKEINFLKTQQLINVYKNGMKLTRVGHEAVTEIHAFVRENEINQTMEKELANYLKIAQCTIVPGAIDRNSSDFEMMGKKASLILEQLISEGSHIVAVTGGSTMKMIATQIDEKMSGPDDLLFVSARGGLNEEPSLEANVIAQTMAQKYHGKSRRLYAPNYVQPQIYESLINEPDIHETLQLVEKASIVLYSIGEPIQMAKRRRLPQEVIHYLIKNNVVAEAFGEFINDRGEVIYKLSNIGLQFEMLSQVPHVVIVSGGLKKAPAIEAHLKIAPEHAWLVTDESAAKWILKGNVL